MHRKIVLGQGLPRFWYLRVNFGLDFVDNRVRFFNGLGFLVFFGVEKLRILI
jgi:hypothetical protein